MRIQRSSPLATEEHGVSMNDNFGSADKDGARAPWGADGPRIKEDFNMEPEIARDGLKDYQLGDCLGKGAFGSVFRALNMGTGETVAVKQIKLADLPKSELRVITLEIDLLKNLDHPNIVKYRGFVKSTESLNIILEYCENGSLHSISKNFGKFPENLVGIYMSQVLHGLLYLHEQGVIHRDIKGANILTTKQGLVKLADFGVATKTTTFHESSVVGTPYWMAPEVIELSGATTASDIWSLGCTVIELLDGKPPYHKLQPMHALFRIVNDDHPPIPEGASPIVRDFLMQCFQKDHNLRVSARKLLKHPWIVNAKRSNTQVPQKPTEYTQAVKSVQEWNEALKSPDSSFRRVPRPLSSSPIPHRREIGGPGKVDRLGNVTQRFQSPSTSSTDKWDDDFEATISPILPRGTKLPGQDNFGGLLTTEKLRYLMPFDTVKEEGLSELGGDNEVVARHSQSSDAADPLKTIKPDYFMQSKPQQGQGRTTAGRSCHLTTRNSKSSRGLADSRLPSSKESSLRKTASPIMPRAFIEPPNEDFSDLVINDASFAEMLKSRRQTDARTRKLHRPSDINSFTRATPPVNVGGSLRKTSDTRQPEMRRTKSSVEIQRYAESEIDEDFSDIFDRVNKISDAPTVEENSSSSGGTLMLSSKLSNSSWLSDNDDDDDDPFAQFDEPFDELDLEANVARDKYARVCTQIESLVGSLKTTQADDLLADISEQLLEVLCDLPETKSIIISAHGMLPILEILETCRHRDVIGNLLRIVNTIVVDDTETQENLCFVGGIPIITQFASKRFSSDIRLEAAAFIKQMFEASTLTLQMFVSSGGLKVLVEFLEEDYEDERELVLIGVNGIWRVFESQGPTPKNDFCRILSRNSVLDPLSLVLSRVLDENGNRADLCEGRIANIFFLFSQAENHVKELVAERTVLHRVLKELRRMSPAHQITMLKFIKNLSMLSTTLDPLQNSNAIDVLTDLLRNSKRESHYREVSNQILNTIYNLCRLNKSRQEDAALNGIIPLLQGIVSEKSPLKEFALPVLCDMAASGKVGRRELWRNKGLSFYISLLSDEFWQVTALDAIFIWLQEETAKVEENLLQGSFTNSIVRCFTTTKANAFENLLEPLQKLLRLSPPIALTLAHPDFFYRTLTKLQSSKAVVRLNLLRIIRSICDASDEQGALLKQYGLEESIERLAESDAAVLVRNMAGELLRSCEISDFSEASSGRRRTIRRSSSSITPPTPKNCYSGPSTPIASRMPRSGSYMIDRDPRPRNSISKSAIAYRTLPRNDEKASGTAGGNSAPPMKSKLPRTTSSKSPSKPAVSSPSPNKPSKVEAQVTSRRRARLNTDEQQAGR